MRAEQEGRRRWAGLRLLRVGHHDPSYSRNLLTAAALRHLGIDLDDVALHADWRKRVPELVRVLHAKSAHADGFLVGFSAHTNVPFVRAFARGRPVICDPLISLWEAAVEDRKTAIPGSPRAWRAWISDLAAFRASDVVVFDTATHADWAAQRFRLQPGRVMWIPVGSPLGLRDRAVGGRTNGVPTLLFYGSYVPLQGADVIVRAARILEQKGYSFELLMIGGGQTFSATRGLAEAVKLESVNFLPRTDYGCLADLIATASICLGIFGTTPKSFRVIPNKVYDALAAGKATVTADTPAARELLTHGETALLVPPGDPVGLADAIRMLLDDPKKAARLGARGRRLFEERCSVEVLANDWSHVLDRAFKSR